MTAPVATYRLQLRRGFGFREAASVVPYLADLGISTLYSSPILRARTGSTHGYDVCDPTTLNPELGFEADFLELSAALRDRGMGLLLDIVPNHMAASHENPWWHDVLKRGPESEYAGFFDIDWEGGCGKVVLPVLGGTLDEVLGRGEIRPAPGDEGCLEYFDRRFPVNSCNGSTTSLNTGGKALDASTTGDSSISRTWSPSAPIARECSRERTRRSCSSPRRATSAACAWTTSTGSCTPARTWSACARPWTGPAVDAGGR
jgi:maltooligosyltrehalose synthase